MATSLCVPDSCGTYIGAIEHDHLIIGEVLPIVEVSMVGKQLTPLGLYLEGNMLIKPTSGRIKIPKHEICSL